MNDKLKKGDYVVGITADQYKELQRIIPGTDLSYHDGDYVVAQYKGGAPYLLHLTGSLSIYSGQKFEFEEFRQRAINTFVK